LYDLPAGSDANGREAGQKTGPFHDRALTLVSKRESVNPLYSST